MSNGKKVHWSLGNGHWVFDIERAEFIEDSVKSAKKAKTLADADSVSALKAKGEAAVKMADSLAKADKKRIDSLFKADKVKFKADSLHKAKLKERETYKPTEHQVKVYFAKDTPKGSILLKNARIVTMNGAEVIENGELKLVYLLFNFNWIYFQLFQYCPSPPFIWW